MTDTAQGKVTYAYDANGNRTQLIDANGHVVTYTYDTLNRLGSAVDPLGYVTEQWV